MKKSLLVAALAAGFASTAQADVSLYGRIDFGAGYEQTKTTINQGINHVYKDKKPVVAGTTKVRSTGIKPNIATSSRWGLKGSEDLGNGTSAIFQLEGGFNPETGKSTQGGALFGRKAIIGLKSKNWGTLTIGRQNSVADDMVSFADVGWSNGAAGSTLAGSISTRQSPTIKYLSPNLDGFKFGVVVLSGDEKTTEKTVGEKEVTSRKVRNGVAFGLNYNNGPLELGAAFEYNREKGENEKDSSGKVIENYERKIKGWSIGAAYDFEVVKLHLAYGQQHDGVLGSGFGIVDDFLGAYQVDNKAKTAKTSFKKRLNSEGLRTQGWFAGLTAPVGEMGQLSFTYQGGRIRHSDFDTLRINTHIYELGYKHKLSKRTYIYAIGGYGETKYKGKLLSSHKNGQFAKVKYQEARIGLVHYF
ncbi:porin [Pelistega ratti]|uniref:porin n=1 Tax=Pelistega ratti TaxID=2652177 RepID=UPI0013585BC2|nr:porin [Pelistega ratti]